MYISGHRMQKVSSPTEQFLGRLFSLDFFRKRHQKKNCNCFTRIAILFDLHMQKCNDQKLNQNTDNKNLEMFLLAF